MKQVKIKSYFISLIISILGILIATALITFLIVVQNYKEISKLPNYKETKVLVNEALSYVEVNFGQLKDLKSISELEDILEKNKFKLQVLNLDGQTIYNSNHINVNNEEVNIKYINIDTDKTYNYIFPVVVNGRTVGNSIFSISKQQLNRNEIWTYFIPIIIGIMVTVVVFLKMYVFIKEYILSPIEELKYFTDNISKGKYKNKLKYEINSEITGLCSGFELMQEELVYSLERQTKLEKERKELIACISHDLKTPLASIKAYVGAIKDGFAKDQITLQSYVKVIDDKADNILSLINDFFEHSKAELGELRINKSQNYSKKFILKIVEAYTIEFNKKGMELIIDTEVPEVLIDIDSLRMEQVIFNLFQNAMKYTSFGGSVHFGVISEKSFLRVYVKDTGIGISNMDLSYIFDKFFRGEKEQDIEFQEGAGLGLYICKYIVEAHGGEIYVESEINQGTTIYFTIPKI
ncbi:MAG: HAMP domain-containing histidine kinase [Clostridiaceae bacterium]|nr:HAMP domain-containing histidine kinase [Clostridiaceae bacterium]